MQRIESESQATREFGRATMGWANLCHNCGICAHAEKRPQSGFGRAMRWHRTWCPGWNSHIKVYGLKDLS